MCYKLHYFNIPNPSSRTKALGLIAADRTDYQKIFLGSRVWPPHKAAHFTPIYEAIVYMAYYGDSFTYF
jgi:hypothetical protein